MRSRWERTVRTQQSHRLTPRDLSLLIRPGQSQRRQPVEGLPGRPNRLPAGCQDPDLVCCRQQRTAQLGRRGKHVLAVIQDQQQLLPAPGLVHWRSG
jgi:hypothetical protein